jgi:hypothetical protein
MPKRSGYAGKIRLNQSDGEVLLPFDAASFTIDIQRLVKK